VQVSIVVSTIVVVIEDPADDNSPLYITVLELIFGVIFSIEFLLKVSSRPFLCTGTGPAPAASASGHDPRLATSALGLGSRRSLLQTVGMGIDPRRRGSYLRDPWNIVDFVVVVVFYVTTCTPTAAPYSFLRTVRAFRALRPIKLISKHAGIKHVVNCILMSVPPALNVSLVCSLFFFVFAIVGVELFKGKFARCKQSQDWDAKQLGQSVDHPVRDWLDCQGTQFPDVLRLQRAAYLCDG
jgi:hypothetical protein